MKSSQLPRGSTWSSAVPPTISSAADEYRLWPTLRALSSTFSNRGYERIGLVTTLHQVLKLLSVWLSSVRFCLPEESNHQRRNVEGAWDSSIVQYGALLRRAGRPQGASPQLYWATSCACLSWVRYGRIQMSASNTIRPCRRNGAQGKWEPPETCRNVHPAKHVRLHGLGPNTESGIVRSAKAKTPLENAGLDGNIILKWMAQKFDVSAWRAFMSLRVGPTGFRDLCWSANFPWFSSFRITNVSSLGILVNATSR
jgi:hypothetical protein